MWIYRWMPSLDNYWSLGTRKYKAVSERRRERKVAEDFRHTVFGVIQELLLRRDRLLYEFS